METLIHPTTPSVTISNPTARTVTHYAPTAIPTATAETAGLGDIIRGLDPLTGRRFVGERAMRLGMHSVIYNFFGLWETTDTALELQLEATEIAPPPHTSSQWIVSPETLIPTLCREIGIDGNGKPIEERTKFLLDPTPAHQSSSLIVFKLQANASHGITATAYVYVYRNQDTVPIEVHVAWSDRADPDWAYYAGKIWLETEVPLQPDYGLKKGQVGPWEMKTPGHSVTGIATGRQYVDGTGADLYGTFLCFPYQNPELLGPPQLVAQRWENILAVMDQRGPVAGVSNNWDDENWLSSGIPRPIPHSGTIAHDRFLGLLSGSGDLWDQRPRGLLQSAGSTGAQQDFGACKLSEAVTEHDPRAIWEARYSISEGYRPIHHYGVVDTNGFRERVQASENPEWLTWSQTTHCQGLGNPGPGPGTLSKDCKLQRWGHPRYIWTGKDDQHRGSNNLAAIYALTGSFMLRDYLEAEAQCDIAMHENRIGAPRAVGRLLVAMAHSSMLDIDPIQNGRIAEKVEVTDAQWDGKKFLGDPTRTVRVVSIVEDLRVLRGRKSWVPWQEGICGLGLWCAQRGVTNEHTRRRITNLILEVGRTVIHHAVFLAPSGQYQLCLALAYRDGADEGLPLAPHQYYDEEFVALGGGAWWDWTAPIIAAYVDVVSEIEAPTEDQVATDVLAKRILTQEYPGGRPKNRNSAEWFGALPLGPF